MDRDIDIYFCVSICDLLNYQAGHCKALGENSLVTSTFMLLEASPSQASVKSWENYASIFALTDSESVVPFWADCFSQALAFRRFIYESSTNYCVSKF